MDLIDMIGQRVIAQLRQEPDGPGPVTAVAGVLLPPAAPGEPYRIHPDGRAEAMPADPEDWAVTPQVSLAERRADRRRTRCPDGRWIYRHGDLPGDQLATKTMLQRSRRRLADGQKPIASYMMMRGYAPLYAVADTTPMPALSAARQEAWEAARRCAGCAAASETPHAAGPDGKRYCEDCQEPAAEAYWHDQRAADRQAAAEWAREVLAEAPHTVLIYSSYTTPSSTVHAQTIGGRVLISRRIWPGWRAEEPRLAEEMPKIWTPEHRAKYADVADVLDTIRAAVTGRRLIVWGGDLGLLQRMLIDAGAHDIELTIRDGDRVRDRWSAYVGQRSPHENRSYRYNQRVLTQQPPSWEPPELVAFMRTALATMAAAADVAEAGEPA